MVDNHNDSAIHTYAPAPGVLVSGHFSEPHGYEVSRPDGTRDWLMTLTLSGRGEYSLHGERFGCEEGDVVVLPPGIPHHYYTPHDSRWEFVWAHFNPELRWMELLRYPHNTYGAMRLSLGASSVFERTSSAFMRLVRENRHTGRYAELLSLNALEEVLVHLAGFSSADQRLDARVSETLTYLTDHLNAPHTVAELASRVSLSPSRFSHLFKEQTGDSVMETLLKLRLKHAARLLEHTPLLVSEIAGLTGFQSPFYFTKQFTALFGCSPTNYRKRT
ncbi:helix-turn-helix domain-containing protein [Paenibacillus sp. strain BS8-2]